MPSNDEIDTIILDLVRQASLLPRGKTISADMFPEARAAISRMMAEARIAELKMVDQIASHLLSATVADRIEHLKQLHKGVE